MLGWAFPCRSGSASRDERVLRDVHESGEPGIEQRHLDPGAPSPRRARQHADCGVQSREHVYERHPHLVRRARRADR